MTPNRMWRAQKRRERSVKRIQRQSKAIRDALNADWNKSIVQSLCANNPFMASVGSLGNGNLQRQNGRWMAR